MEVTDTETHTAAPATAALTRPHGLAGLLGTGDHKALGRVLITLSVLVVAAAEVLGFLLRLDSIDGTKHSLLSAAKSASLSTLQPTGIVLVGLIPLLLGIGLVVVPLQIGARAVAFPRAAAAAVWGYFMAGTLFIVSYFTGGGAPNAVGGVDVITRSTAVDLWVLSLILLVASIITLSVVLITTVFTQRAPGMTMSRIPVFAWSIVVAGIMWTISLAVLGALLIVVWVDHSRGAIFSGGSSAYSQLVWFFNQPQIYAVAIPVLGIVCDITSTFTRTRDEFRRSVAIAYVGFFGITTFGAYTVLSYAVFANEAIPTMRFDNPVTIVSSILVFFPVLATLGLTVDKFIRGRKVSGSGPVKAAPLPGAVVAILLLSLAVFLGMFTSFRSLKLHGTLFEDAVIQLVIGATIAAVSAALFHWASKIAGANALNPMGMVAAILAGLGSAAIAVADVAAALTGSTDQHIHGSSALNTLAVVGWVAVAGTVFLTIVALAVAVKRYVDSDTETVADPWGVGQSLEWATATPPLYENFVEIPPVISESPLLDELTESDVPNQVHEEVAQ